MTAPLHNEPDTGVDVVQALLRAEAAELAALPLTRLSNTGSDNALYRLGAEFVVRLPRFADAARRLGIELDWLPRLADLPIAVPTVVVAGSPNDVYPFRWAVLRWLDGIDAWEARQHDGWFGPVLGVDLAAVVQQLRGMSVKDAPAREPGERGGPLRPLDGRVRWWLDQADGLVDTKAVCRVWQQCLEGADDKIAPVLLHGDLIPGNLLVAGGRLTTVLDWGGAAWEPETPHRTSTLHGRCSTKPEQPPSAKPSTSTKRAGCEPAASPSSRPSAASSTTPRADILSVP